MTTVFFAKNHKRGSRSKHLDIKYLAIKDHIKSLKVFIEHIYTKSMIINDMKKGMQPKLFKDHVFEMRSPLGLSLRR